jgi:hypothetical protein
MRPSKTELGRAISLEAPFLTHTRIRRVTAGISPAPLNLGGTYIGKVPLSTYATVTWLSIDQIREIYELLVETYATKGTVKNCRTDLIRQLKVKNRHQHWGIPVKAFKTEGGPFVVVACIIANKLNLKLNGSYIETETFSLGVKPDGEICSKFYKGIYVEDRDFTQLLQKPTHTRTMTCPIYASIYRNICREGGRDDLKLAIRILYSRWSGVSLVQSLVDSSFKFRNMKKGWSKAKLEAITEVLYNLDLHVNPMSYIWERLVVESSWSISEVVSEFGSDVEFAYLDSRYNLPPYIKDRWRTIIINMKDKYEKHRTISIRNENRRIALKAQRARERDKA